VPLRLAGDDRCPGLRIVLSTRYQLTLSPRQRAIGWAIVRPRDLELRRRLDAALTKVVRPLADLVDSSAGWRRYVAGRL
jgi:hypothetical protein